MSPETNEQTNTPRDKQTNKQTNKQTSHTLSHLMFFEGVSLLACGLERACLSSRVLRQSVNPGYGWTCFLFSTRLTTFIGVCHLKYLVLVIGG